MKTLEYYEEVWFLHNNKVVKAKPSEVTFHLSVKDTSYKVPIKTSTGKDRHVNKWSSEVFPTKTDLLTSL